MSKMRRRAERDVPEDRDVGLEVRGRSASPPKNSGTDGRPAPRAAVRRRAACPRRSARPRRARSVRRRDTASRSARPASRPPAKPPPGSLWPTKSRKTETTIAGWKSSRTSTSRRIDRFASAMRPATESQECRPDRVARCVASRCLRDGGSDTTWDRRPGIRATPRTAEARDLGAPRVRRRCRLATPVATTTSTRDLAHGVPGRGCRRASR